MFKTPEQLFKTYLGDNVTQLNEFNYAPFDEIFKKAETESSTTKMNLTYKDSNSEETVKASLNYKSDVVNKAGLLTLKLDMDEYADDANIYVSGEKLGIQSDLIHEKYIVVENRDLKKVAKLFGVSDEELEEIPDSISKDLANIAQNEEKINKSNELSKKYVNRFFEQISEDKYSAEKKVQTDVNGENITANKYSLSLTDKELATIIVTTLREFSNDPELIALADENSEEFKKSIDELKENIDDFEKDINNMEEKPWVISVYESGRKVVKTEIKYDEIIASLFIDNNETESKITLNIIPDNENNLNITISNNFNNENGEFAFVVSNESSGEKKEMKISLQSTKSGDSTTTKLNFSGDNLEDLTDSLDISFNFEFGDVKVNKLEEENSIVINDFEEEDLEELINQITENIQNNGEKSIIGQYLALMGSSGSSYDNYDYYLDSGNSDYEDIFNSFENSANTEEERAEIERTVETAMKNVLQEYNRERAFNSDADPAEFLTEDNIKSHCDGIDISVVDGSTLKTEIDGRTYFTKIYINGDDWTLDSVETIYSEDGVNY